MAKSTLPLASIVLLTLIASVQAAEPRDSGEASPLESLAQSIWRVDDASSAHHLQSGVECPFTAGSLTLDRVMNFDPVGLDVSCNYSGEAGIVTLYLTKRGERTLQDDLARADAEIDYVYADSAEPVDVAQTPQLTGDTAFLTSLYAIAERGTHSGIWVGDFSGWTLKFRASYSVGEPVAAVEAMSALLIAAEPARLHLLACAASPATARDGQIKEDDSLPIVGALLLAARAEAQTEPTPTIWCAESAMPVTRVPLLLWRNVGEAGASYAVLRVSGGTNGPPPILEVMESSLGALTDDLPDDVEDATLDFLLIGVSENTPLLYTSFDGIPDASVLGPLAEQIFLGERVPVASVGETGTINIHIGGEEN